MTTRTSAIALCLLSLATPAAAVGPVYDVNSFADVVDAAPDGVCETALGNGICTLRAAVMEANAYAGADEVTINLQSGTYALTIGIVLAGPDDTTTGNLVLTKRARIVGKGIDASIIDANHVDRALRLAPGAVVTLQDLRIQGGRPPYHSSRLGDGQGGGIYSQGANLTLVRCLVRDNQVIGACGGGIFATGGSLTLVDSMVRVNTAYCGGGLLAAFGAWSISGSAIYANSANDSGGGIYAGHGTLTITNSTISGNAATGLDGGVGQGGGIALETVPGANLLNVTVATNTANGSLFPTAGGISLSNSSAVLSNSIVFNTNATGFDDLRCVLGSTLTSNGFNDLHTTGTCSVAGSYTSFDPQIVVLAANGGPSVTHALGAASPAAGAGNTTGCTDALGAPLLVDQRGVKRPIGARCDLGAFEREPIGDANGDGSVTVSDVFYLINYLFAGGTPPV